jgi:hypothetical protein
MVKQYPYKLLKKVYTPSVQDEDGNWSQPTESWVEVGECRDESNTKGAKVNLVDGSPIVFASTIYMPKGTETLLSGSMVKVIDGENLRVLGEVKRFVNNQLNCQAWV